MAFEVLKWSLVVATAVWWGFVVWYTVRSKWWKNKYGRNLANVGVMIASLFTILTIMAWVGWQDWMVFPATVVMIWSIFLGGQRTYYMEQAQRE